MKAEMRLQGGRQSFELFLSFQNVTFFQTKPRSTRANILQLPNPNDPTKTHACFNLEKGPLLSSNKKCILRTPTYISYYVSILFFLLSEHLILVVFNVAARAPLHANPFMPTQVFLRLMAACLLLLRRVSLSRPHAGVQDWGT